MGDYETKGRVLGTGESDPWESIQLYLHSAGYVDLLRGTLYSVHNHTWSPSMKGLLDLNYE